MKKNYSLHVYFNCVLKMFLYYNISIEIVNVMIMSHYANMSKFDIYCLLIA